MSEEPKKYRIYFGKKFYKIKDGYWANMMPIHAHRWVWICHHGAIPKGMDIHHKDGDKDNNEIENLEMLSRSDHLKRHWKDEPYKRMQQLNKARPQHLIDRNNSPEGRKNQRIDAIEGWKNRKTVVIICEQCGSEKETPQPWTRFCSDACDKKWRRANTPDKVEFKCAWCGKVWMKDRYSPTRFCSHSCGGKNSAFERNKSL